MKKIAVKVKNEKQAKVAVDYFNEVGESETKDKFKDFFDKDQQFPIYISNDELDNWEWFNEGLGDLKIISFSKFKKKYINKRLKYYGAKECEEL